MATIQFDFIFLYLEAECEQRGATLPKPFVHAMVGPSKAKKETPTYAKS